MEESVVFVGLLNSLNLLGLFNDAHECLLPTAVAANRARIIFGIVAADRALADPLFEDCYVARELFGKALI